MTDAHPIADLDKLDAIARDETIAAIVARLALNDHRNGGRPREHSAFSYVLFLIAAKTVYGGRVRRAWGEFNHPKVWEHLAAEVRAAYPDRPELWLSETPFRRGSFYTFRDTYLTTEVGIQVIKEELERSALRLVALLGLCQPETDGSWTNPNRASSIEADGTVVRSISSHEDGEPIIDPETGEVLGRRRGDPEVSSYREGGSDVMVQGHKLEILSARGEGWYHRAILSVDTVRGGEMETLRPMLDRLLPQLPGVHNFLCDGAMRGDAIEYTMRQHGVIPIVPMAAQRAAREGNARVEKQAPLGTVFARTTAGTDVNVELWVRGGQVHSIDYDETGAKVWVPLTLRKVSRRGRTGAYRFYADYDTADDGPTVSFTLPLLPTDEDRQRKFNRCENYRVFAPKSPQYTAVYGRRSDTESSHRQLKDALWQRRANGYGSKRVLSDALAWAVGQNAIAAHLYREAAVAPPIAA